MKDIFGADCGLIKRGFDAKVADMRAALSEWADKRSAAGNGGIITIAPLKLVIERQLRLYDENGACNFVEGALRKVLRRQRRPVQ